MVLDVLHCWQCPTFSEITLQILEKGDSSSSSGRDKQDCSSGDMCVDGEESAACVTHQQELKHSIPCSAAILSAGSEYFKTALLTLLREKSAMLPLIVNSGEADAALEVVKSFYTGSSPSASVTELVLMCKVGDRLQASTTPLFIEALVQLPLDGWKWDDVIMVSLPCVCHVSICIP